MSYVIQQLHEKCQVIGPHAGMYCVGFPPYIVYWAKSVPTHVLEDMQDFAVRRARMILNEEDGEFSEVEGAKEFLIAMLTRIEVPDSIESRIQRLERIAKVRE